MKWPARAWTDRKTYCSGQQFAKSVNCVAVRQGGEARAPTVGAGRFWASSKWKVFVDGCLDKEINLPGSDSTKWTKNSIQFLVLHANVLDPEG